MRVRARNAKQTQHDEIVEVRFTLNPKKDDFFRCLVLRFDRIDIVQNILGLVILDRHHVWRSLDPTLDIWSNLSLIFATLTLHTYLIIAYIIKELLT